MTRRHRAWPTFGLLLGLIGSIGLSAAQETETGTLVGRIESGDKEPLANATVVAYHLATGATVRSSPTQANGRFEFLTLENGYYDLAIETGDRLYVANQVTYVPPGGTAVANMRLVTAVQVGEGPRDFPGSDRPASGVAQVLTKDGGNKKVIAWSTAGGVAAALLLAGGSSSSGGGNASPAVPD